MSHPARPERYTLRRACRRAGQPVRLGPHAGRPESPRGPSGRATRRSAREARHMLKVRALGQRGQVADLHVFEHALPKRGHGGLLWERRGAFQAVSQERRGGRRSRRWRNRAAGLRSDARSTAYRTPERAGTSARADTSIRATVSSLQLSEQPGRIVGKPRQHGDDLLGLGAVVRVARDVASLAIRHGRRQTASP